MKKYKVTMWIPYVSFVKATSKDRAIEKALDDDNWDQGLDEIQYGSEKYEAKEIK